MTLMNMEQKQKRLLVTGTDFLPDEISQHIKSAEVVCTSDTSEESLSEKVKGFDGMLFMQTASHYKITRKIIESGDRLRFVQAAGVGYDQVDVDAATDHGVLVTNVPGATTVSVAEHAVALIMACAKNIVKSDKTVRGGGWLSMDFGVELQGKTLGIVGFGRIGREVARRMKPFGMTILAYGPHMTKEDAKKEGCKKTDLQTLLRESDIISIHTPLTKETKELIGEAEFGMMKGSAILVNTSRGEVVDEKALISALSSGRIRSAGLDVYQHEPIEKDNPLLKLENVVLTPHGAVMNLDAIARLMNQNGVQVERALNGIYDNVVNPDALKIAKNGRGRTPRAPYTSNGSS